MKPQSHLQCSDVCEGSCAYLSDTSGTCSLEMIRMILTFDMTNGDPGASFVLIGSSV